MSRPLYEIAKEIRADWNPVHPYAAPYVEAMEALATLNDSYYYDSAVSVVAYFLANASRWRGEKAKAVKAELKAMLKEHGYKL